MHLFLFSIILSVNLFAGGFNINFFKDKPSGVVRDFYIWLFLNNKKYITPKKADILKKLIYRMNDKLLHKLAKFSKDRKILTESYCKRVSSNEIVKLSDVCINIGLTTYEATTISVKNLNIVISKLKKKFPFKAKVFEILNSANVFEKALNENPKIFLKIFNESGGRFRERYLDKIIPQKSIDILSRYPEFNKSIFYIVTFLKFKNLPKSLFNVDTTNLTAQSCFYLALNAIKFKKYSTAKRYLEESYKKSYFQKYKDRATFWLYLITGDREKLKKLTNSNDINIYSLYAFERLNLTPKNIITKLPTSKGKSDYDIKNPFWWQDKLEIIDTMPNETLIAYAQNFDTEDTLPFRAYILQKADFSKRYFITPYLKYVTLKTPKRKALLYAIAKQESKFIPTEISSSYALGMMQFLPFVAKEMAKSLKIVNFKLTDMFDPQRAILFATFHIEYLRKYLKHPLFIAYGYNGGLNFTKKAILKRLFKKGDFEPFMSIELIPSEEPREYGKAVLANYIIYSKIFGKKVTLLSSLRKLIYH